MKKRFLIITIAMIAVAVLAVVFAFVINQELINRHMYPQDALHEESNLSIRGIVTSIEQNYVSRGMVYTNYHIFRYFIRLNITEVVWTSEDYLNSSIVGDTIFWDNSTSVGYDYLDSPQLALGQEIECKGFYLGVTDTSYSFILTVAPSVSESYLKTQN